MVPAEPALGRVITRRHACFGLSITFLPDHYRTVLESKQRALVGKTRFFVEALKLAAWYFRCPAEETYSDQHGSTERPISKGLIIMSHFNTLPRRPDIPMVAGSDETSDARRWATAMCKQLGGIPDSYVCFDTETTGLRPEYDVVVEWGHCVVVDRQVVNKTSFLLNWMDYPRMNPDYVCRQLEELGSLMDRKGKAWHITCDQLKAEGVPVLKGLATIRNLLEDWQSLPLLLVGHNSWRFDAEMIKSCCEQDLCESITFLPQGMLDTGAIEKSVQRFDDPRVWPQADDTWQSWAYRVLDIRGKTKWALDTHCVPKYGLEPLHGVKAATMHTAAEDAYVLHLLLEEYRKRFFWFG